MNWKTKTKAHVKLQNKTALYGIIKTNTAHKNVAKKYNNQNYAYINFNIRTVQINISDITRKYNTM